MINMVISLAFLGFFLLLGWIIGGVRDYLQVRRWHRSTLGTAFHIPSVSDTPPRSIIVLGPGGRVIPANRPSCSHWPRDEVKLPDGATVAYICRRCDHDWANEDWVRSH